ncbi:hypothetical protein C1H46_030514 [Malus baccata]|uniref:Uncharacterized protein n=1 Tax=Malus baccata TaxID=106549 RepID=A0A540LBT9_MALBA|nr:hypothetical protein C1H46_030514 [Malus baccata]
MDLYADFSLLFTRHLVFRPVRDQVDAIINTFELMLCFTGKKNHFVVHPQFWVLQKLLLKEISDRLSSGKKPKEMPKLAIALWTTIMRHPQASEIVVRDIISHFVLQLVYCTQ